MNTFNKIHRYNILSNINAHGNYMIRDKGDPELAKFINSINLNSVDTEEIKLHALRCLDDKELKKILLTYEFNNIEIKPKKHISLDNFLLNVMKIINRYQHKAGGFYFEDDEWIPHRSNSEEYVIQDNAIMIENSISIVDIDCFDTQNFIDRLEYLFENQADNIEVDVKYVDFVEDKIVWVQFWFTDTDQYIDIIPDIEL